MIERLSENWHLGTYRHSRMLLAGIWKESRAPKYGASRINVKARQNSQVVIPDLIRNPVGPPAFDLFD
jgi:hypothetical protein